MRRTVLLSLAILAGGAMGTACGSTSSSSSSTTTAAATRTFTGSAYSWLATKAEVWNHALNLDQNAVAEAGAASSESSASEYFERLATACNALLTDAGRALAIPHAPTPTLDSAWRGMLAQTRNYASDCLTLTRTGSNADLTRWNNSLNAMDAANATFNQVVNAVRGAEA